MMLVRKENCSEMQDELDKKTLRYSPGKDLTVPQGVPAMVSKLEVLARIPRGGSSLQL